MKKRAMKKLIPKGMYCGDCKWRKYIKTIKLDRSNCEYSDICTEECWSEPWNSCENKVYQCKYLGIVDINQHTYLWGGCKECNVKNKE